MSHVTTLISHPGAAQITGEVIEMITDTLNRIVVVSWLDQVAACDIDITADETTLIKSLAAEFNARKIDFAIQKADARRKSLLIADMDSTMIEQECIDELADAIGIKDKVSKITARAMRGEIEFEPALRERVGLLKGLPLSAIDEVIETRITLRAGGRELVQTMKANGSYAALVSGGFTMFTSRIAALLGFDENRANTLLIDEGRLTGNVQEPILGADAKVEALREICAARQILPRDVMAIGDGANDLGMIRLAGCGVAVHAKPKVAADADIAINHGDLTALLYLQGYKSADFIS